MRGFLCIEDKKKDKFIDVCFDAYWMNNLDISKEKEVKKILYNCEIEEISFNKNIKDQKIKDELKQLTNNAFEKNVFGAPTFIINKKLFWGQDRLDYAVEELNN